MLSGSADELEISQLSVSRIIHKIINALFRLHIVQQFIKFPLDKWQLYIRGGGVIWFPNLKHYIHAYNIHFCCQIKETNNFQSSNN